MRRLLVLLALVSLAACGKKDTPPAVDAGPNLTDPCNSAADAQGNAACQLTLDQKVQGFVYPSGDHDWYHLTVPAPLPPRALLQVTAGIDAPSSPVTLQLLVFRGADPAGLESVGAGTDSKPRGAPAPVEVVERIDQPGDYWVLVQDDTSDNDDPQKGDADSKHAYSLTASVASDPDLNEPNDTPADATPVALSGGSATVTGVLAVTGDVDVYAVDIPASSAPPNRAILYLGLDAPAIDPPVQTRLQYTISIDGSDGGVVASGAADSPVGEQQVATARLVPAAGRYLVTVQGYKQHLEDPDPSGDPRLQYTLTFKLLPDLDTNEPNDTAAQAKVIPLGSVGQSASVTGRIGYVPDPDWFEVQLGSSGQNTRLQWQLALSSGSSPRFPPAGHVDDDQITIGVVMPDTSTCIATCKGADGQIQDGCGRATPVCIYSYRKQIPGDSSAPTGFENFVGELPVAAGGARSFHLLVEDQANDGADDKDYTLSVQWVAEPSDESGSYHDDAASAVAVNAPVDNRGYTPDPSGASGVSAAQGYVSYGHAHLAEGQAPNATPAIPIFQSGGFQVDYDAYNDADFFRMSIPQPTPYPDGGIDYQPLAWESAWNIGTTPGLAAGSRPYDLQMTYFFCDPAENPTCDPTGTWQAIPIGYHDGNIQSWVGSDQPGWDVNASNDTFVTRPNECFCIEPRFVQGGVAYLAVSAVSRTSYLDAPYRVSNAFAAYPQSYTASDGTTKQCPTDTSGSCHFCNQSIGPGCVAVNGLELPPQQ